MIPRALVSLAVALTSATFAQTTDGVLTGRVLDEETGRPISNATIVCINEFTNATWKASTNAAGRHAGMFTPGVDIPLLGDDATYVFPALPPGSYRISITAPQYQAREVRSYELPVAAYIVLDVRLRPAHDLWESSQRRSVVLPGPPKLAKFYGPDLDFSKMASFEPLTGERNTAFASVSFVVTPREIEFLPLAGRDVYSTLVLQPGVTSSSGTARGLGLSVNGQRYTSSNFLLDGVENNSYLTTGPLTTQPPEVVQEYRISTANFSPEYGRTSGFVVNAVTRSGGSAWHGIGYLNFNNDVLNANEENRRYQGLPRPPVKEIQPGAVIGGPLVRNRLFALFEVDQLRNRGRADSQTIRLPSVGFVDSVLRDNTQAASLFRNFRIPAVATSDPAALSGLATFTPTESVDRTQANAKFDWIISDRQRLSARTAFARLDRPDFVPSPYPDFTLPLETQSARTMAGWVGSYGRMQHELRVSVGPDSLSFERSQPNIPTLLAIDDTLPSSGDRQVLLPSNPRSADFRQSGKTAEVAWNASRPVGNHFTKFGFGWLGRNSGVYIAQPEGAYTFNSLSFFRQDTPQNFAIYLSRLNSAASTLALPAFNQDYRSRQFDFFVQDSWRLSPRLLVGGGVRFDYFGAPVLEDAGTAVVRLGTTGPASEQVRTAQLGAGTPGTSLYDSRPSSWQGRISASYALSKDTTFLRAGFGLFADRPFENLFITAQMNDFVPAGAALGYNTTTPFLESAARLIGTFYTPDGSAGTVRLASQGPQGRRVVAFESGLRNPLLRSFFSEVEHRLTNSWTITGYALMSNARHLTATDEVNRDVGSPRVYPNPSLPQVYYRNDDGYSRYRALLLTSRWQTRRYLVQVNYSFTHSFDNQSDALANDFDLLITATSTAKALPGTATFTRNYDFRADEGASDFDQRHNLVVYSIFQLPAALSGRWRTALDGWTISQVAAIRSGYPFSVYAAQVAVNDPVRLFRNRADLTCADPFTNAPVPGGRILLRAECFAPPPVTRVGNTARNQFYGPGLVDLDLSVSRTLPVRFLGEGGRLTFRADAYNFLNHANLNNPESRLACQTPGICDQLFGEALYGRREAAPAFPAQKPLIETARRIQLILRLQF